MKSIGQTAPLRSQRSSALLASSAGFSLGCVAATAYLLLDGPVIYGIPRWAEIVFYPGFVAGFRVNEWGLSVGASQVVGVFTVGLNYAALALLGLFTGRMWRRRRPDN